MVVRISGEGQYRLDDAQCEKLNELEQQVHRIVEGGEADGFRQSYEAMLDFVRSNGEPLADDDLEGSDVILPPADISFEEAGSDFTGEGLIPD
jgi:23S rRNA A2030 N6-methylase RlmJ